MQLKSPQTLLDWQTAVNLTRVLLLPTSLFTSIIMEAESSQTW